MTHVKVPSSPKIGPDKVHPVFVGQHLVIDPRVCHGKMTFKGTRVPVETVLSRLAQGRSMVSLRKSWPEVSMEAIKEAVTLAANLLTNPNRNEQE